jgi:predicted Zn-dependent peptidase
MKNEFKRVVLKNGFTILFEKRDLPLVSVAFAVKAGGINEKTEEKGISHYIEHMLYKGTSKRNVKQISEEIERRGGELNGFTSEEIVTYWCKIPSKHIDVALDVLGDMVLDPLFDEKELEKERKVIFEEIKMYKDNPRLHVFDEIHSCLYGGTLAMHLAGTKDTMNAINRKKIVEKFKELYTPNNMVLCVVGDAKMKKLVDYAEKHFGNEKGKIPEIKFDRKNQIKVEERKGIDQANMVFAFHAPNGSDELSYASICLINLLAGGMSSRLFSEIREKRNLAYSVKGEAEIGKRFSYCSIYIGTMKENTEQVHKLILEEFEKVSKTLTPEELESVKEQIIGNYEISLEDSRAQMVNLLAAEVEGDASRVYDFEKKVRKVKLEDVKKFAKKVAEGDYSLFSLVPKD